MFQNDEPDESDENMLSDSSHMFNDPHIEPWFCSAL